MSVLERPAHEVAFLRHRAAEQRIEQALDLAYAEYLAAAALLDSDSERHYFAVWVRGLCLRCLPLLDTPPAAPER